MTPGGPAYPALVLLGSIVGVFAIVWFLLWFMKGDE